MSVISIFQMGEKLYREEICCLIISFNPDARLLELVNTIKNQVDQIVIVDNN